MNFDARIDRQNEAGIGEEAKLQEAVAPQLDFIFGPPSLRTNMKRQAIARDLEPRLKPRYAPIHAKDLETMPVPEISSNVRFNLTSDELLDITAAHTPNTEEDLKRVLRYALVWSGVRVHDDTSARWLRLDEGQSMPPRYPRITVPVDQKRLSLRAVPQQAWGDASSPLRTPFELREYAEGKVITMERLGGDALIAQPDKYFVGDSVQTLAYLGRREKDNYFITANPIQRCSHRCGYCCRGFHTMTENSFNELVNMTGPEMARYMTTKFDVDDWAKIKEVAFITGVFPNDEVLLRYLSDFGGELKALTKGRFDPKENRDQTLKVSSHLLRDERTMKEAKKLGVNSFIFTMEMADNNRRAEVMPLAVGKSGKQVDLDRVPIVVKGRDRFETILDILRTAIDVYGADNVSPVMVVGLDSRDISIQAMDRLKGIGVRNLIRGLNNIYDDTQFPLYQMPFEEAVTVMQYARDNFASGHRRIVDESDRNVKRNTDLSR
jgi:hypothetical protein